MKNKNKLGELEIYKEDIKEETNKGIYISIMDKVVHYGLIISTIILILYLIYILV